MSWEPINPIVSRSRWIRARGADPVRPRGGQRVPQTGVGGEAIGQVLERVQSGRVQRKPLTPPERLRLPIALALAAPGLLTAGEDLPTPGAGDDAGDGQNGQQAGDDQRHRCHPDQARADGPCLELV